jgi:hypothetical protein
MIHPQACALRRREGSAGNVTHSGGARRQLVGPQREGRLPIARGRCVGAQESSILAPHPETRRFQLPQQ